MFTGRHLGSALKRLLYPWWGLARPKKDGTLRPYFGPPSFSVGGPNLKRIKLSQHFSNYPWHPNLIYVTSGLPMPKAFLKRAKQRGIRILLNQDGVYTPSWYGSAFQEPNHLLSQIHDLSDYVIYQSRFCLETARRYLRLPSDQRYEILYNAVDLDRFKPACRTGDSCRILSAGYFYPGKHYILRALMGAFGCLLRQYPEAKLLLAGQIESNDRALSANDFMARLALEQHIPPDRIRLLHRYTPQEAPGIFAEADLFVHLKNNDPCPSVVLEAMASGLPVVHCSTGGTPELVGEGGVVIEHPLSLDEPDRAAPIDRIGAALQYALKHQSDLSVRSRQRAEMFSLERWMARHAEIMREVCLS